MKPVPRICHFTSRHQATDNRIYHSEVVSLQNCGFSCTIIGPDSQDSSSSDIKIISLGGNIGRNLFQRITVILKLLKMVLKERAMVYHFHDPELLPVSLILKLFRKRVIYDVHDEYEKDVLRHYGDGIIGCLCSKVWWWFEGCCAIFVDGVVVPDEHLAKKFSWKDPSVLGNYPRLNFISSNHEKENHQFNLIYVGGVTRERGVDKMLEALTLLSHSDIRCHIIGNCNDIELRTMMEKDERVEYYGRIDYERLHGYYAMANVGLALYQPLPSFLYCQHSVKIVECSAAGIPVITSDIPGLVEFVHAQGIGINVDSTDPVSIAEAINRLYEDRALCDYMGKKGRHLFETAYNWEAQEDRLITLYQRILQQ